MTPTCLRLVATALLIHALAPGQGVIVPGPIPDRQPAPIAVQTTLLQVHARIVDGTATTELNQTLRNLTPVQQEAIWLLPLPPGATADRFTMTVNGQAMPGEVLDAGKARQIYETIVRQRRDPGLLEYHGHGMLRARVFPIPPNGEVLVQVRFAQVLPASGGIASWRFPLRSAWADGMGPQKLSLLAEVSSQTPIKTVFSPLPGVDLSRHGECQARASFETNAGQMPARDLELHYGLAEQDFGVHLLTHRKTGAADGTFLMLLAPKRDWPKSDAMVRSITLVIDTSGSMAGEKIQQARGAVRQFLQGLSPNDFFNVVAFSTEARPFFASGPVLASKEHVQEALAKVEALEARGGTNIDDALTFALKNATPDCYKTTTGTPTLVPITVFLTDGLPTVGQTDVDQLLAQAKAHNSNRARVFAFGVGHDVNTRLLDALATKSGGDRDYVLPGEDIEVKTGALFTKLSGPVMTGVQVTIDGLMTTDLDPTVLPDLFVTGQMLVVGRYRGEGHKAILLRGKVGTSDKEYVFEGTFPAENKANDWLPALWAQRKVTALLDAIRANGQQPELVAEVTRLGKEFGIVTPFTSHLILEEQDRVARQRGLDPSAIPVGDPGVWGERMRDLGRGGLPTSALPAEAPGAAVRSEEATKAKDLLEGKAGESGADAVTAAHSLLVLRAAAAPATPVAGGRVAASGLTSHRVGDRQFHLIQGTWVDGAFTTDMQARVQKVEAFSDAWFALVQARPHLAQILAFSTKLVLVDGDAVFEIG
ncbi:MAG: VWA domain-containing protein [Planctomycetes bacterium]|nr:VWA domain-containing protein [Planctomycetota bacterium]